MKKKKKIFKNIKRFFWGGGGGDLKSILSVVFSREILLHLDHCTRDDWEIRSMNNLCRCSQ